MSTRADRRFDSEHLIRPIKVYVRQTDGTYQAQWVEADMRRPRVKGKYEREKYNYAESDA